MLRRYDLPPGEPHACVCPPRPAAHVPPKCAASSCTTEAGGEGRDGKMLKHFQKMFVNLLEKCWIQHFLCTNVGATLYKKCWINLLFEKSCNIFNEVGWL
jgi:hypothetical protein